MNHPFGKFEMEIEGQAGKVTIWVAPPVAYGRLGRRVSSSAVLCEDAPAGVGLQVNFRNDSSVPLTVEQARTLSAQLAVFADAAERHGLGPT